MSDPTMWLEAIGGVGPLLSFMLDLWKFRRGGDAQEALSLAQADHHRALAAQVLAENPEAQRIFDTLVSRARVTEIDEVDE